MARRETEFASFLLSRCLGAQPPPHRGPEGTEVDEVSAGSFCLRYTPSPRRHPYHFNRFVEHPAKVMQVSQSRARSESLMFTHEILSVLAERLSFR
jgi:hypothetical protein